MFTACGGRVIDDTGTEFSPSDFGYTGSAASSGRSAGSAGKSGTSRPPTSLPSKQLPPCVPGFDRAQNPWRDCRWVTETGMCFEDTDAACACICPTDRESVCSHGFDDGPNGAKLVLCD